MALTGHDTPGEWFAGLARDDGLKRFAGKLLRRNFPMLMIEPEDLIQELILKFHRMSKRGTCPEDRPKDKYLQTACRHLAVDLIRRSSNRLAPAPDVDDWPCPGGGAGDATRPVEDGDFAEWVLAGLTDACRQLIRWKFYEGLGYDEIAGLIENAEGKECTISKAKMRVSRAVADARLLATKQGGKL